ncbi:MAG: acyl-CoA dehydrogenase family protein, partial [Planctomycetota bacterium]
MEPFESVDFFGIEELLTEDERLVQHSVREFVSDQVVPIIDEHFEKGTFPSDLIPQLGELGVLGANLDGYGCAGLNNVAYGLIMQELERGDSGVRSFVSVQGALVMYPIYTFGTEEQKQKYLPKLATGEMLGQSEATDH